MKIDGLDVILKRCECQISACYPRFDLLGFAVEFFLSVSVSRLFFFYCDGVFHSCVCVSCVCQIVEYLLYTSNENDNDNGNNTY